MSFGHLDDIDPPVFEEVTDTDEFPLDDIYLGDFEKVHDPGELLTPLDDIQPSFSNVDDTTEYRCFNDTDHVEVQLPKSVHKLK
jgi:hypothetical protein